jgi:hypothetical protein
MNLRPMTVMSEPASQNKSSTPAMDLDEWLAVVRASAKEMRFGSIQITVHEGRVTQVEATEKTRFPQAPTQSEPKPAK